MSHYHADNGRFADEGFVSDINDKGQEITFCGVGTHQQNGIVENKNKVLTQGAQTLLIHGMQMWPQMIDFMFWLSAMKAMTDRMNSIQIYLNGSTPESIMYGIQEKDTPVKSFHTLFCPVYVLDIRLHTVGFPAPLKW